MTETDDRAGISWVRAMLTSGAILVVGLGLAVGVTNYVMTDVTGLSRDAREYLASAIFFAVLIGLAVALRRLQRRNLI